MPLSLHAHRTAPWSEQRNYTENPLVRLDEYRCWVERPKESAAPVSTASPPLDGLHPRRRRTVWRPLASPRQTKKQARGGGSLAGWSLGGSVCLLL